MGQLIKIQSWTRDEARQELAKRLKRAADYRRRFEEGWYENERILFTRFGETPINDASTGLAQGQALVQDNVGATYMDINISFRHLRFIHSQMSNNPPVVLAHPTSSERADRQAARAADHFVQHGKRQLKLQEKIDLMALHTLVSGSGYHRIVWDPCAGEPLSVDMEKGELLMTGEILSEPVSYWDIYLDPDAKTWDAVKWLFHRHMMPYEEAVSRWPEQTDKIKQMYDARNRTAGHIKAFNAVGEQESASLPIYEYWERGLPWNGMAGRHAFILEDGCLLEDMSTNPFPTADLPFDMLTDIEVPGQLYGKTFVDYIAHIQDLLNRLDSQCLDNVKAHNVVRVLTVDGGTELASNDGWDIQNVDGASAIQYIPPAQLMQDGWRLQERIMAGIDMLAGVNDPMKGQVTREMSGFSMQTAIDAGNLIRARLFNKYRGVVESVFKKYLLLVQQHYTEKRQILITGEEDALSVAYYSGADIAKGFDLQLDYGTSFSLNPSSRREEIMALLPLFKEAGLPVTQLLDLLRLNEVSTAVDRASIGERRMNDIFDEIISNYFDKGVEIQIPPEENEDHKAMLDGAMSFRMSATWRTFPLELRNLLDDHINMRKEMLAKQAAPGPAAPAPMGAEPAAEGAPAPGAPGPNPLAALLG